MATAVATVSEREAKGGLPALFNTPSVQARLVPFLPEGVTYDRMIAAVQLAAQDNPEILQCTPKSIIQATGRALQTGLEIGVGVFLVPFNVKVSKRGEPDEWEKRLTHIIHYTGYAQLMIASRAVRHVDAKAVYEHDVFEYVQGSEPRITHLPNTDPKARGKLKGAYAVLYLPFGVKVFDYMPLGDEQTPDTIEYIRQKHSKQWKHGPCPAWYAKKTVVRQVAKLVPKDPRLAKALAVMEQDEREEFGEIPATARMLDDEDDVPRTARALRPGTDASDPVNRDQRARSIRQAEYGGGEEARVEVGSLAIDEAGGEEYQDDRDIDDSGELALGDTRRVDTRVRD